MRWGTTLALFLLLTFALYTIAGGYGQKWLTILKGQTSS